MATTAIPYLLEDLMLVQAFMVSLHVPQLQGGDSVKTVLRELVPMSQVCTVERGGMTNILPYNVRDKKVVHSDAPLCLANG